MRSEYSEHSARGNGRAPPSPSGDAPAPRPGYTDGVIARPLGLAFAALVAAAAACGSRRTGRSWTRPIPPGRAPSRPSSSGRRTTSARARSLPPSPALPALQWSPSAAATAQAWADGCRFDHNPGRGSLGENIAAGTPGYYTPTGIVGLWAAEAPFYDLAADTCDTSAANGAGTCGHYTQLVWRDTLRVGCGWRTCTSAGPFGGGSWDFWVCDYEPAGNVAGQRPY